MIRKGTIEDAEILSKVEATCFPPNEAATSKEIQERLNVYANHFLLLFEEDRLISFIDGFCTNQRDLTDEMYSDTSMHDEDGDWQMIFGLNTLPSYQRQGYAAKIMNAMINMARQEKRKGLVLTCKDRLVPYYSKFGFKNEGVSSSVHGGVVWPQYPLPPWQDINSYQYLP
jgi:GNAT superfamily N-acetyltransferase